VYLRHRRDREVSCFNPILACTKLRTDETRDLFHFPQLLLNLSLPIPHDLRLPTSLSLSQRCTIFDFNKYDQFDPNSCIQSPSIIEQTLGTLDALPGCNPVDYGPGDVTVCNEEKIPEIEDEVTISGDLVGGETKLKVKKSGSGGGGGSTKEAVEEVGLDGEHKEEKEEVVKEETEETDSDDSTASKSDSSPEPTSKDSTSATSSSSPKSTSTPSSNSQSTSNEPSSDLSSTFERNKALFLCLIFVLPVILFVTIVLCCKFSCGRARQQTLAREYEEDKALAREGESKLLIPSLTFTEY